MKLSNSAWDLGHEINIVSTLHDEGLLNSNLEPIEDLDMDRVGEAMEEAGFTVPIYDRELLDELLARVKAATEQYAKTKEEQ